VGSERAVPKVAITQVEGGGFPVTDPASGRRALQPGHAALTTDSGTVVLPDVQQGSCVVAANGSLSLSWPGRVERLDLATGRPTAEPKPRDGQLAAAGSLVAVRVERSTPLDPLRSGKRTTVVELLDAATGDTRAQVATTGRLDLLPLEAAAVVLREGNRVVCYTLG
jgi:hypothetical protein